MNDAIANMIAMPSAPDTTCPGCRNAVDRPSGEPPPRPTTTASNTSTIATSASSSTPSTRPDSSMRRYPRVPTIAITTIDHDHHGSAGPPQYCTSPSRTAPMYP
jgi:hypothetical protein